MRAHRSHWHMTIDTTSRWHRSHNTGTADVTLPRSYVNMLKSLIVIGSVPATLLKDIDNDLSPARPSPDTTTFTTHDSNL